MGEILSDGAVRNVSFRRGAGLHRESIDPVRWTDDEWGEVSDAAVLLRLRKLAIPPAWTSVWASVDPAAPVQATGVDARGRTQYRYSAAATARSAVAKYEHMLSFASSLPVLRRAVSDTLTPTYKPTQLIPREQVVAVLVRLLERGLFRVGNERYVRDNHTYGLTTLQRQQVGVSGDVVSFDFVAKEHVRQQIDVADPDAARVIRMLLDVPGSDKGELFVSEKEGILQSVRSTEVNAYLHAHTSAPATAKLFRTWGATTVAAAVMAGAQPDGEAANGRSLEGRAVRSAADLLGNTPTVARGSYIHPAAFRLEKTTPLAGVIDAAAKRHGTRSVHALFTDEALQAAIVEAISAEVHDSPRAAIHGFSLRENQ